MKTLLLTNFVLFISLFSFAQVTINEVDANTPMTDVAEFVELYSATEVSLDGHVLVLFNGSDDASYAAFDLSGNSITDGYFVIGNALTPNVDFVIDDNTLQNGADAVALFTGVIEDFPNDTPVTTMNLVDAVVYGTNDGNDLGLFPLLDAGCQVQVDEDANGDDDNQSSARIPDGGTALCPDDFVQQAPTPGVTNVPSCFGGEVMFSDSSTETTLCIDDDAIELLMYSTTSATGDGSIYVITDEDDVIIGTTTSEEFDTNGVPEGVCRIHHVSYNGVLDMETTAVGEDASGIASDGDCVSFSSNYLTITRNICFPDCDGGTVLSEAGTNIVVCLDDEEDQLTFTHESLATETGYWYVITDEANLLVGQVFGGMGDFNILDAGVYRIWGMSYGGDLDINTLDPGDPLFGIMASNCVDISEEYITVTTQECVEVEGCGSIFFSEYQEGSSNNKALEIYNPTQLPVSLLDYQLVNCSNGCDVAGEWDFTNDIFEGATIAPGDVFVIAHTDADAAIQAEADINFNFLSNGDDVFALQRISNGEIIDMIGEPSVEDVGDGWTVNGVENGTQNHTLVRMEMFNEGNPDWATAQNEWEVLDQDVFENIGSHTIIPCSVSDDASVSFTAGSMTVDEDAGVVSVEVSVLNPLDTDMTVEVMLTGGTAVSPDDFDGTAFPITLTFPGGMDMAQSFNITIVDDIMEEGAEDITLELMNPSTDLTVGSGSFTLNINPSDVVIPVMDIVDAAEVDADGVAINDGMEVELRAVVYGVNMRPAGLQFTLIDPTDGIGVFLFEGDLGYTVLEGDSVHVVGSISQFNGLTQIAPTSVELISSGNMLKEPTVTTELIEASESDLIVIDCVELVDPSQWSNSGSGFNVDLTDGTNTFAMRIDADTNVYGTDAPEGVFTVTGIGGQFDSSSPYDEGYQILPRYIADISVLFSGVDLAYDETNSTAGITQLGDFETSFQFDIEGLVDGSTQVAFSGANEDITYEWTFGGTTITGNPAVFTLDQVDGSIDGTFSEIDLVVVMTSGDCSMTESTTASFIYTGINEQDGIVLEVYPNPTSNELTLNTPENGTLTVYNQMGQSVKDLQVVNTGQQTVSVSDLSTGVYFIELRSEDSVYRVQFIKK